MAEVARIRWRSAFPTEIDEVLAVDADGGARLVVRTARDGAPVIGTFTATATADELALLEDQHREVDLRHPTTDPVLTAADAIDEVVDLGRHTEAAALADVAIEVAKAQLIAERLALSAAQRLFDTGGASATARNRVEKPLALVVTIATAG